MKRPAANAEEQLELALSSVLTHDRFPGRSSLLVREVAEALGCDERHILDLITEGELIAVDIAGGGNKTARRYLRIPVSAYDQFIKKRAQKAA